MLIYVPADFFVGRLRRCAPIHKHSEGSDWILVSLLFLAALTCIPIHIFRVAGEPLATYTTYVVHMGIVAPMLIVEVPFGKWAHMLYRSLAVYLAAVRRKIESSNADSAIAA